MSFKDFIKSVKEPETNESEKIMETKQSEAAQGQELKDVQEKLRILIARIEALSKIANRNQEGKTFLMQIDDKIDKIAKTQIEYAEKIIQIEKNSIENKNKTETATALHLVLIISSYAILCTALAIAQNIFQISGMWGIWSYIKIFTGLKLLF